MSSRSWKLLPSPSPSHRSGSSQCTSPEHSVSCIEPGLAIYFTYDKINVSMLFSQIILGFSLSSFILSAPALSTQSHALNLDWRSISHIIIYIFQCYFLKSLHPCLLPLSAKDCYIHLCLFWCIAYRVIVTIFLNSIYIHWYSILVFFFLTYFTLYNRPQFHPPH